MPNKIDLLNSSFENSSKPVLSMCKDLSVHDVDMHPVTGLILKRLLMDDNLME